MSNNNWDPKKEFFELQKLNYDNLHKAFWEAHNVAWTMTKIFVPVISGGLGFFIKEYSELCEDQILGFALLLMMVVWFWYSMLRILDSYNATRREQLKIIEKTFNEYYPSAAFMNQCLKKTEFKQYTLIYKRKWLRVVGFDDICFIMSVFVTAILVLILQRSEIWDIQTNKIILVGFLVIFIKVIYLKL